MHYAISVSTHSHSGEEKLFLLFLQLTHNTSNTELIVLIFLENKCHEMKYIDGLMQDCINSIANALELLQSCTKPLI